MTVVCSSAPPARPTLAMLPQKSICLVSPASISPPTLSMAPANFAASSARVPSGNSSRAITLLAPSDNR